MLICHGLAMAHYTPGRFVNQTQDPLLGLCAEVDVLLENLEEGVPVFPPDRLLTKGLKPGRS